MKKRKTLTLENILQSVLKEGVSSDEVLNAIQNKYYARIKYDDGGNNEGVGNPKGSRLIQPMAIGTTKKGYPVVRAFQLDGNSRRGAPNWKFFRLDRIVSWNPMPNKHFNAPPNDSYGEYNKNGDRTMGTFMDNAKFDDFVSPLERAKQGRNEMPKMSTKNVQGPIAAQQQWKKNVFTSQPNSSKYAQWAKNIKDTSSEIDRFNDDIWAAAEKEKQMQNSAPKPTQTQQGYIGNGKGQKQFDFDENDYDVNDVDFNENDYVQNNNRRR